MDAPMQLRSVDGTYPVADLRHDIAVDREHVEHLKQSIRERGQLAPIIVWDATMEIIDGFHRQTAMHELGVVTASVRIVECSEEEFEDLRVLSATMHKGVSFARVTRWVQDMFYKTEWAKYITSPTTAFRKAQARRSGMGSDLVQGLNLQQSRELLAWVEAKSKIWGLSPGVISQMLSIAEIASPALVSMVRTRPAAGGRVLTKADLRKLTNHISNRNVQEAVAHKIISERLPPSEAYSLIENVAAAPKEKLDTLLSTDWLSLSGREARKAPATQPASNVTVVALQYAAGALTRAMETGAERGDTEVEKQVDALSIAIAEWRGEDTTLDRRLSGRIEELESQVRSLTSQRDELQRRVTKLEGLLNLGRRMYRDGTQAS